MTVNPFLERYKNISDSELLEILNTPSNFQPLAVEAAQLELTSRKLTTEQLEEAKLQLNLKLQEKSDQEESKKAFQYKVKSVGSSLLDNLNPIQKTEPSAERLINVICIGFGILFLYRVYADFGLLKLTFQNPNRFDSSDIAYLLPFILLPTGLILFWLRKKMGWTLLTIQFAYITFSVVCSLIIDLKSDHVNIPAFENIFPHPTLTTYFGQLLFFGGTVAVLLRRSIRNIYLVSTQFALVVLGIIAVLTIFQWWGLLTD